MDENIQLNMMSRVAMGDCLRRTAKRFPNNIAVKFGEKTMSYMEWKKPYIWISA